MLGLNVTYRILILLSGWNETWNDLHIWYRLVPLTRLLVNRSNMFKTKLDKFWQNHDIIYNFKAQLQGTGGRSKIGKLGI